MRVIGYDDLQHLNDNIDSVIEEFENKIELNIKIFTLSSIYDLETLLDEITLGKLNGERLVNYELDDDIAKYYYSSDEYEASIHYDLSTLIVRIQLINFKND